MRQNGDINQDICIHLRPILATLRSQGSTVIASDVGWSVAKLALSLDRGPPMEKLNQFAIDFDKCVEVWENNDPHYSIENGVFCNCCKQGMSWPKLNPS